MYTRFDDSRRDLWISGLRRLYTPKSLSTQDDNERDEFLSDLVATKIVLACPIENNRKDGKEKPRRTKISRLNESEQEELKFHHNELPMLTKRKEFLSLVESNDVVIVVGETGSGKSTQIPQYLLESYHPLAKIICCQPRRVSAISIANRVSKELPDPQLSGYRIRGDSRIHGNRT